jgi:hypothetical protein
MKKLLVVMSVLGGIALTGCVSNGLSAGAGRNNFSMLVNSAYQKPTVQDTNAPRKPLKLPLRLAVAEAGEAAPAKLFVDGLQNGGQTVTSVVPIPLPGDSYGSCYSYPRNVKPEQREAEFARQVESARHLAGDSGADYLLLIGGTIDGRSRGTVANVFDLTIIGCWIVPANELKSEGKAVGVLFDVASGRAVFMTSVEARDSKWSGTAQQTDKLNAMRCQMRDDLYQKLAGEVQARLVSIASQPEVGAQR